MQVNSMPVLESQIKHNQGLGSVIGSKSQQIASPSNKPENSVAVPLEKLISN
jgi:hypothetical protein